MSSHSGLTAPRNARSRRPCATSGSGRGPCAGRGATARHGRDGAHSRASGPAPVPPEWRTGSAAKWMARAGRMTPRRVSQASLVTEDERAVRQSQGQLQVARRGRPRVTDAAGFNPRDGVLFDAGTVAQLDLRQTSALPSNLEPEAFCMLHGPQGIPSGIRLSSTCCRRCRILRIPLDCGYVWRENVTVSR